MRALRRVLLFWVIAILVILPGVIGSQSFNLVETCRANLGAAIESSPAGGDWPMFRHDAHHTGYVQTEPAEIYIGSNDLGLYSISTVNCSKLWRFQTGGPVKSSPAVRVIEATEDNPGGKRIYFGSDDGKLYALNEGGALAWSYTPPSDIISVPGAIRSSPLLHFIDQPDGAGAVDEDRIFFGSDDGLVYTILLGDDRSNVNLQRFPSAIEITDNNMTLVVPSPIGPIRSSPVVDVFESFQSNTTVTVTQIYYGSLDREVPSIEATESPPQVIGGNTVIDPIELLAGSKVILDGPVQSSPAVNTESVVFVGTTSGTLYAIRPDFIEQWRARLDGDIVASPAVASTGTIFIGSMNGTMDGVRPNGTIQCTFRVFGPDGRANSGDEQFFGIRSSAAITPDGLVVFGADDGYLYVIQDQTCSLRASFKTNGPIVSSPMVAQAENNRRKIFFGSGDGFFYALTLF